MLWTGADLHTQLLFTGVGWQGSFPRAKAGSPAGETEMGNAAELTVGRLVDPLTLHSSTQEQEPWLPATSSLLSR